MTDEELWLKHIKEYPQIKSWSEEKREGARKGFKSGLAEGRKEGYEQGKNNERELQCGKKNYEKDISRLEKENKELLDKLNLQNQRLNELKKENAELKVQNKDLCESLDIMNNRESELLDQIEKMKCCGNCKHNGNEELVPCTNCHIDNPKWELAE